jgi:hypothetical protein
MSQVWDLPALMNWVERERAGDSHAAALLRSLGRSSRIFYYHAILARDSFLEFKDDTQLKMTAAIFGADADDGEAFQHAAVKNEANLIASINVVRNSYETFAQTVNALLLNGAIELHKCNIHKVISNLPHCELREKLERAVESGWYLYLSDFTNTIKHKQLIHYGLTVSFKDNISGGRIDRFTYEKPDKNGNDSMNQKKLGEHRSYPSYWVSQVLEGVSEVHNGIAECGKLLNQMVIR